MKFYLETLHPEAVTDLGQYFSLSGVIVPSEDLCKENIHIREVLDGLQAVLPEDSELLVQAVSTSFRTMLIEARKLKASYPTTVPMFPVDPDSYMAIKACRNAKIPCALCDVLYLEQAWIAHENGAGTIVLDMKKAAAVSDPVELMRSLAPLHDQLLVCGLSDVSQVRLCIMLGIQNIGLSEELCRTIVNNPASEALCAKLRVSWIQTFARDTVL